jgi:hypothetical protein
MKFKTLVLSLSATAALALAEQPASAADTSRLQFRGRDATTSSETVDGTGCRSTSLYIQATEFAQRVPGDPTLAGGPFVGVFLRQQDNCDIDACGNPRTLLDANGFFPLPAGALAIEKNLGSARLHTTVLVTDFVSGSELPLTIDLTWTATGPRSMQEQHFVDVLSDQRIVNSSIGFSRSASASGTVTDGQTNFTPEVDSRAVLSQASSGVLVVSK